MTDWKTKLIEKLKALRQQYSNFDKSGSAEDALEEAIAIVHQEQGAPPAYTEEKLKEDLREALDKSRPSVGRMIDMILPIIRLYLRQHPAKPPSVTPEMISAGLDELAYVTDSSQHAWEISSHELAQVYLAMRELEPK